MSIAELAELGIIVDVPLPDADDCDMVIELDDGSELNFNDGE